MWFLRRKKAPKVTRQYVTEAEVLEQLPAMQWGDAAELRRTPELVQGTQPLPVIMFQAPRG